jgi:hypothetical protein
MLWSRAKRDVTRARVPPSPNVAMAVGDRTAETLVICRCRARRPVVRRGLTAGHIRGQPDETASPAGDSSTRRVVGFSTPGAVT